MKNGKLRVALVGVSFGAEFVPIYLKHPDVDSLVLVDTNEKLLNTVGDKFLLEERLTDFNAMLEDKTIDAVHRIHKFNQTAVFPCLEGNTAVFYCLFLHTYFPIGWVAT